MLLAVALISASALAYEILLMRLFSIIQWQHFAWMMISLALLGYGASGGFLSLLGERPQQRLGTWWPLAGAGFAISMIVGFLLAQALPFNPLEMLWELRQWGYLGAQFLLLLVPFLLAASCTCMAITAWREDAGAVYAADLAGAGLGASGIILLLQGVTPLTALWLLVVMALGAALCGWLALGGRALLPGLTILSLLLVLPGLYGTAGLRIHAYKPLSQTLSIMGTRVVGRYSSAYGQLDVVASPRVPFRHAPGLSLGYGGQLPEQLAVFIDAGGMSAISRRGAGQDDGWLDEMSSALPYHLLRTPRVLVLGAGTGMDVQQALALGAQRVDAVELNPQMLRLVRDIHAEFNAGLYRDPRVRLHQAEVRGYIAASRQRHDVIQLSLLDSFNTSAAGLYALNESYLYTVEAIRAYLDHLRAQGYLALTRWVRLPPRDGIRLFATVVRALREAGFTEPGRHLLWIRSWKTSTLLVKAGVVGQRDIERLLAFCAARGFDPIYYPGIDTHRVNLRNRLPQAWFHQAATALLGTRAGVYLDRYKFDIAPSTDDRPWFFQSFRWRVLPEILELKGRGGLALLDSGYLILVITLLLLGLASTLVIMLPLLLRRWPYRDAGWCCITVYFASLGLAFMLLEISYIQRFILFLSRPIYAAAVILAGFLVFAGLGSLCSRRFGGRRGKILLYPALFGIGVISLVYHWLLPSLFEHASGFPDAFRIAISLLLIAPLAFCMGIPFPLGLERFTHRYPRLIPWAWAINGCAAVMGASLATLLSLQIGNSGVMVVALGLYLLASIAFARGSGDRQARPGLGRRYGL